MNTATHIHSSELYLPDRGRVGVVCLMMSEAALFTIFVAAYVF